MKVIGCEVNALLEHYKISTLKTFFNLELNKLLYYIQNVDMQCFGIDFVMIVCIDNTKISSYKFEYNF